MLEHQYETFLTLCRIRNYTKTAQQLRMTQPGVTQHIHYLEKACGGKLFEYRNRTLTLTPRGEKLLRFVSRLKADSIHAMETLQSDPPLSPVHFGATLTIGEYIMPPLIQKVLAESPGVSVSMLVGNTDTLLGKLTGGEIQFSLLEGFFDQSAYDAWRLQSEAFIAVCSPDSPLAKGTVPLAQLLDCRLILREQGSGTRDILEQSLLRHNLTIDSFASRIEIGNMSAIKQLVAGGLGVSFMYLAAAASEIQQGTLCQIRLSDFSAQHDFCFVALKDSVHKDEYHAWFERFRALAAL